MEVSASRSRVFIDRNFSSTVCKGSNGPCCSALSTRDRSQEGIEGGRGGFNPLAPLRNLMTRSCFPIDFPSTGSFKGGGRQTSLQPLLQKGQHDSDRTFPGVFAMRRAPLDEQVPFQGLSVSCRRYSRRSDGVNCRSPRTSASHPQTRHEVSRGLDAGATGCPISESEDPSSKESAKENCHEEHQFRWPSSSEPVFQETYSRGTPAQRNKRSDNKVKVWRQAGVTWTRWVPRCHAQLGTRPWSQCWSGLIWSSPSGVTAAADAICPSETV